MTLNTNYMISPNLQEYFVDKTTGTPLAAGNVFYYSDTERSTLKTVYTLVAGVSPGTYVYIPLPNPVPLSGVGTTTDGDGNDIRVYYYPRNAEGGIENYYIVVKDADGVTQFTRQAWPNLDTNPPVENNFTYNFARNWTFYSWSFGTTFNNVKTGSTGFFDFIMDDWIYKQSDSTQTINISRVKFDAGANPDGVNAPFYVDYQCTSVGSGLGTYNRFEQQYQSVQTLNGNDVVVSIWLKKIGATPAPVSISLRQYFGSGGSPHAEVETTILTISDLTTEWKEYTGTITLPSISGMQIGTNEDDYLILNINMPLNQTSHVNIGPIRFEEGVEIAGSQQTSNDTILQETDTFGLYPAFTTGDIKFTIKNVSYAGWLLMDDLAIGSPSSAAAQHKGFSYYSLFELLWTNITSQTGGTNIGATGYAQLFNSAGIAQAAVGASALADWDAGKCIQLTRVLGRALAVSGSGPGLSSRSLGQYLGEENHTLIAAEVPNLSVSVAGSIARGDGTFVPTNQVLTNSGTPVGSLAFSATGSTTNGGGGAHNNMQPSVFLNVMIKI